MAALMKLILTQDVTGLGAPGDVVEVAPGYGRNYLVPQGLAIQATRGAEKQIATIRRAREVREVVAAVAGRHLDDVTGRTEPGDVLGQDELHQRGHVSAPSRCRAAAPSHGCS